MTTVTRQSRLAWIAVATALYALAGVPLTLLFESAADILSTLPVALAAGLFGWRGGLALAILCIPLNTMILNFAGVSGWDAMLRHGDGLDLGLLLAIGLVVGALHDLTVRKLSEATQQENDARFRLLTENAEDLIFRYRFLPAPGFDYVSPSATTIVGYTPEEHYADPNLLLKMIHPDDRARFLSGLPREGQAPVPLTWNRDNAPFRWYRKDGSDLWAEARVTVLHDEAGQVVAMEGIVRDVTARMAAEVALRESEEHFRAVVETLSDGVVVQLPDGTIRTYNASAQRLLGLTIAQMEQRVPIDPLWQAFHADGRPHTPEDQPAQVTLQTGAPQTDVLMRVQRPDGVATWLNINTHLLPAPGAAAPYAVVSTLTDITARKAASEALRRSEATLAEAERIAHLGSWESELQTSALTWSDETYRILGHAPRSFAPTYSQFLDQVHPDERAIVEAAVTTSIRTRTEYNLEMHIVRPDGAIRAIHARGEVIASDDQRPRLVGSVLDITERQAAEMALRDEEQRSRELYAAAQRYARDLELLDRVRTALAREVDPAAVFRTLVEAIASIFGHTRVSLYLLEGDELVRQQVAGQPSRLVRLPVARGIMGRVARTGQSVLLEDVASDPEFISAMAGIVSEVCVPLFDEGRVAGVLNLESIDGMRLGEADLRLMTALSEQIGIAIERGRLYAEARVNAENLAAAQRIAHLGSWEYDVARNELRWSDEVFRIGGYAPQAFVPTPERMLAAVHPDDRDRVIAAIGSSLKGEEAYDLDHRIVRPDGEVRMVHQQAEVVRSADGRPLKRVGIIQDVTVRRELEARLLHQAFHDPLTELPNRSLFLDRLDRALTRSRRGDAAGTVLFLDLDRFKDVNDSLGHDAGDRLLVAVASRLRRCLRDADTLARLGGDEFTMFLEDITDPGAAARLAERLARALDSPLLVDGHEHRVTASIGIVLAGADYERAEDVLRDADVAMYRAKEAGKARYAVFDPAMQTAVQARLALEQDLRRALEREEFVLHYQPIVDLRTGRVTKVESLVRWRHPERGMVPPGMFLPVAEETGLIRPLGRWVLRSACRQAHDWQQAGVELTVAVNLTAQEFQGPELVDEVAAALRQVGLDPRWLSLEITESAAMGDAMATVATLAALRALGVGLAIDDFGTGYSSLAYLQRFPVDALKVDKAFVDGLGTEVEDTAIVEAIVTLARTLGLGVVAEGVETAAQAARLAALGCELAQGYYFARPLPPDELPSVLAQSWPTEALLAALDD